MTERATIGDAIASIPTPYFWLIGKGRVHSGEPLYAIQILRPVTNDVIVEAEHDDLSTCIELAVSRLPVADGERVPQEKPDAPSNR